MPPHSNESPPGAESVPGKDDTARHWLAALFQLRALRWLVTLGLLVTLVVSIRPASIVEALADARAGWVVFSLLIVPPYLATKIGRWYLLVNDVEPHTWQTATRSYLAGLALAVVTPSSVGEVGRAMFVTSQRRATLTSRVVLDKLTDLGGVVLNSSVGLIFSGHPRLVTFGWIGMAGTLAGGSAGLFILWRGLIGPELSARLPARIGQLVELVAGSVRVPPGLILRNFLLAEVGFILLHLQAYVLLAAFAPGVPLSVIVLFPVVTLSTILPVSVGGVGVREWVGSLLLEPAGVARAISFNVFLLHYMATVVIPAVLGALWLGGRLLTAGQSPADEVRSR